MNEYDTSHKNVLAEQYVWPYIDMLMIDFYLECFQQVTNETQMSSLNCEMIDQPQYQRFYFPDVSFSACSCVRFGKYRVAWCLIDEASPYRTDGGDRQNNAVLCGI